MDNRQEEWKRSDVVQQVMQQVQLNPAASGSVSSSPSHEFSFTISLGKTMVTPMKIPEKNNNNKRSSFAIDLSPADEIFFHGHLLPLHLLSHLPISPRSSTNSLDSFTLPIHELSELSEHNNNNNSINGSNNNNNKSTINDDQYTNTNHHKRNDLIEEKGRRKSKFFSFLGLSRWRKSKETEGESAKSKFDIGQVVKQCMRLVKPFLAMINRRRNDQLPLRQPHSFSGNLMMRSKKELWGRREVYSSAPASMMTSRTNSGLLVASGSVTPTKSDSTMEELQAAIQAAIAHCKNTLASDHQINLP